MVMAKLRQFSHFLQQINKWEPFPFPVQCELQIYFRSFVAQISIENSDQIWLGRSRHWASIRSIPITQHYTSNTVSHKLQEECAQAQGWWCCCSSWRGSPIDSTPSPLSQLRVLHSSVFSPTPHHNNVTSTARYMMNLADQHFMLPSFVAPLISHAHCCSQKTWTYTTYMSVLQLCWLQHVKKNG